MENAAIKFREAMSCVGAAVNVITSAGPAGKVGFTATAVCSVSDTPPTLIVCMNRSSSQSKALKANGVLCVNTLAANQQELSAVFAGLTQARCEDRFLAASWAALKTGAPVLDGALASFDCIIEHVMEAGTHSVLVCSVSDVAIKDSGEALVYFRRNYHSTIPSACQTERRN
jgi:flavin reductase